jgi:hypothetical protein
LAVFIHEIAFSYGSLQRQSRSPTQEVGRQAKRSLGKKGKIMIFRPDRRSVLAGLGAFAVGFRETPAQGQDGTVDLILFNGRVTTLDRQSPQAQAIAIRGDRFVAVGTEQDVMRLAGAGTRRIDLKGRRVSPGLIDSHMHIIRGGLN